MSSLSEFHFLRPAWLLALLLLPLVGWAWRHVRSEGGNWRAAVDAHLLPHLIESMIERARSGGPWLAAVAWVLATIALAGPAWEREAMPLYRNDAARVLAIELAPTMLAADVKPTRLERARYKLNDILKDSRDMQTALIGYSGDAFVAAPLTDDVNTVRNLIDALDPGVMPVVGNATEKAIEQAQHLIEQAGLAKGELLLLADSTSARALAAARSAHAKGLTVSVLGVGTDKGAPVPLPQGGFLQDAKGNIVLPRLDESGLRALAEAGGGRYATLTTDHADLDALFVIDHASPDARRNDVDGRLLSDRYRDRGPWFLLLVLPLALLGFRRGWLMAVALCMVSPARQAMAFDFVDLWQRPDQQAAKALAAGEAARAQGLAQDPALRGSAAYRAEDFSAASESYAQLQGADAHYNRGNSLAREGKYDEALKAFDEALAANPQMEDARANKQAVADWLKRQQSDQQKNQQGSKDGNQGDRKQAQQDKSADQHKSDTQDERQDQDGQNDPQEGENDKGKDGQQEQPESDAQPQGEQDKDDKDPSKAGNSPPSDSTGGAQDDDPTDRKDAPAATPSEQDRAQHDQQQQALSDAIDKAIDGKQGDKPMMAPSTRPEDEAEREHKQALNQWLQRIPDDPGGLLRRKFQLEYERRQRGDGGGG